MSSVVTLTMNPSIDLFAETEHMVDDGKSRCRLSSREVGGGGINVARNLRRMGVDVLAVFPAGGPNGESFKQIVAEDQLPFQAVEIKGDTRHWEESRERVREQLLAKGFNDEALSGKWRGN
jgi:6-phosphofructokinase 2